MEEKYFIPFSIKKQKFILIYLDILLISSKEVISKLAGL